ncbi:MAG: hypothetical protein ABJO29_09165 [Yoonia sp.]|uniref:hypothetical protein n=1 Tax=Yoonia sp. TaxID=2212373 RepID=UPI003266F4C3
MKLQFISLAMSLAVLASGLQAEVTVNVDGTDIPMSTLLENCQSMVGEPEAKVSCFNALSELLKSQSSDTQTDETAINEALDGLRAIAAYQDGETGLLIDGAGCDIQFVYYANYFHISRRNVSTIDLFSAKFDASKLQFDQISEVRGASAPLLNAQMDNGAQAALIGGMGLDSNENNFSAKSARTSIDAYAMEVVAELTPQESQSFDFVLVHPERAQDGSDIMAAFEAYASACRG